jgi:hypothetical protein
MNRVARGVQTTGEGTVLKETDTMAFLMTSQKAMLHHILKENRFNPTDFEIVPSTAQALSQERGDQVRLRGTEYYFSIYPNDSEYQQEKFFVEYSPGKEGMHELQLCGNWEIVCHTFAQYLGFLAREIAIDDPWKDAEKFSEGLKALPETVEARTPMGKVEREAVWKALGGIQATLLEHVADSGERARFVEEQFEILKDAATKFGRKDYLLLIYTAIIGIATTIGVPPHAGVEILHALKALIGSFPRLM